MAMNANKKICHHCVRESHLRREIAERGAESDCCYCNRRAIAYDLVELANRVEVAFAQHFEQTPSEPTNFERTMAAASDFTWVRRGVPVVAAIAEAAEIPSEVAADVQRLLEARHHDQHAGHEGEETEFCSKGFYEKRDADGDGDGWREQWFEFERSIKTQARFFGNRSRELLAAAFTGIDNVDEISLIGGGSPVVDIGPKAGLKSVYRARVFQSEDALREALCWPDRKLGPPPGDLAPAGRMNAGGISVFYGATKEKVAIAEVRPPVGSLVAVVQFEIIRPLRILSLGNLGFANADGSIFDEAYAALRQRAAFLQSLSDYLCEAIVPADQEIDYLPSQAVADFLATENEPLLDGVAYLSTQTYESGQNVVFFHKAARVEALNLPAGSVVKAVGTSHFDDGYRVTELVPVSDGGGAPCAASGGDQSSWEESDNRVPTLRVVPGSLRVHEVTEVTVSTDTHSVYRQRVCGRPTSSGNDSQEA